MLLVPVVNESKAVLPTFTFVSVNPIPNLPAVIATPTLMFCRNVAFVFVLIFSVLAAPTSSPFAKTYDAAVTMPVKNQSPSLLKVIPLPTTIPFLAVISPTASTFVTSS